MVTTSGEEKAGGATAEELDGLDREAERAAYLEKKAAKAAESSAKRVPKERKPKPMFKQWRVEQWAAACVAVTIVVIFTLMSLHLDKPDVVGVCRSLQGPSGWVPYIHARMHAHARTRMHAHSGMV